MHAAQLEHAQQEVGTAASPLKPNKEDGESHAQHGGKLNLGRIVPVEHFAVDHDVDERAHHAAEHHHIAELGKVDGELLARIAMPRHGDEQDGNGEEHCAHHVVVDILPLVFISQPGGEACANLPENHEEQIYCGHARAFFLVEAVPTGFVGGVVAGRDVSRGFHAKSIFDEREQVAHHQHVAQEAHHKAAQCQNEQAVGFGADVAEHIHHREANNKHHFFASDAHQLIEERRKSRHAHRGDKPDVLYVFCLNAQPAGHLAAVG